MQRFGGSPQHQCSVDAFPQLLAFRRTADDKVNARTGQGPSHAISKQPNKQSFRVFLRAELERIKLIIRSCELGGTDEKRNRVRP